MLKTCVHAIKVEHEIVDRGGRTIFLVEVSIDRFFTQIGDGQGIWELSSNANSEQRRRRARSGAEKNTSLAS